MAKIVKTFQEGRMNKDLDERLIGKGEYRDAMNIEVSTSDGSDAGVVQFVRGNKKILSYDHENDPLNVTVALDGTFSKIVGSVADDKNNDAYFFVASPMYNNYQMSADLVVFKDMIVRYNSISKKLYPVVTDIFRVETPHVFRGELDDGTTNISSDFDYIVAPKEFDTRLLRPGMLVHARNANNNSILQKSVHFSDGDGMQKGVTIREIKDNRIYFDRRIKHDDPDTGTIISSLIVRWTFTHPEPVLQFAQGRSKIDTDSVYSDYTGKKNYIITGINIIDSLLLWTDGCSEPKKINLDRLSKATSANIQCHFSKHSLNLINDPYSDDPNKLKTLQELEDPTNIGLGIDNSLTRDHITVIKKAPKTAPKLIMSNSITSLDGVTSIAGTTHDFAGVYESDVVEGVSISESFTVGSILVLTPEANAYASIRALVQEVTQDNIYTLEIEGITSSITTAIVDEYVDYRVQLIQTDPIFRNKLGRFSYRYKYYDNEFSTFAPWSELAFIPSTYDYTPIKGYNLGMSNSLRSLRVIDFVNDYASRPDDVKEIDILFKDTTSPNVYVVKTIKRGKNFEWHNRLGSSTGLKGAGAKGVVSITTDMIHRTLEESQGLRSWDNVPKTAQAQEVTGSRVVYANYKQGYNVFNNVTVDARVSSKSHPGSYDDGSYLAPYKSIKSIRKYKLGVVFGDKYGRETPVLGVGGAYENDFYVDPLTLESNSNPNEYVAESFNVTKDKCASINKIKAQLNWEGVPEDWMDYYKFYIKETSNEYYNLVMDRWYDNGDGTVWMSFASADRNKIMFERFAEDRERDDTYLILKKGQNSQEPITSEDAKYKVLAVSNEAPNYIKTVNKILGVTALDMTGNNDISGQLSAQMVGTSWIGSGIGAIASGAKSFEGIGWARIKGICSGATPSEILYSEWKRVTNINEDNASISVSEPWGDKANMVSDFGFGTSATVDFFVEVKDAVIENKPEFNGKFFVKIFKDSLLEQNVTIQDATDLVYSAEIVADLGYIYTGGNYNIPVNPADQGALFQGDYSDVTTPTPTNGNNNQTDYTWNYPGFEDVPTQYGNSLNGCNITNNANLPIYNYNIIRDYWEDYWTNSTYGANRWFIDHASFAKSSGGGDEWGVGYNQGIWHSSQEELAMLIAFSAFSTTGFSGDVATLPNLEFLQGMLGSGGFDVPSNKNSIAFSHVGTGYGLPDAAFKEAMTTMGQKFRFKGDPGLDGDPIVYEVWGIIRNTSNHNYKGVGTYGPMPENNGDTYCQGCEETGPNSSFACKRQGFIVFFRQADNEFQGLDTSVWDPRSTVKHDGSSSLRLEVLTTADTSQYISNITNIDNAIWETEPKEDIGLDLYYEASDAMPLKLNNSNIENYIPLYSRVKAFITHLPTGSSSYAGAVYNPLTNGTMQVTSVARDVVGIGTEPGEIKPMPVRIDDKFQFLRNDGTVTEAFIKDHWSPIRKSSNTLLTGVELPIVASYEPAAKYTSVELHLTPGDISERRLVIPLQTENGVDQSTIIGDIILGFSSENYIWHIQNAEGVSLPGDNYIHDRDITASDLVDGGISLISTLLFSHIMDFDSEQTMDGFDLLPYSDEITKFTADLQKITGYYRLNHDVYNNCTILPWFNCYSFGNGLESNRINDDFNAPYINNGFKVSTTLDSYGEESKTNGLIYSNVYNSIGGVNRLNEFNASQKITKDINPSYGPIKVLKSRDTNLVTFCEDKVLQIFANKDSLFNADGSSNLITTNQVLGSTKGFVGDYGIGDSPESLAVDGYRMYFVDKHRNKVLRLSQDGLTIISDIGMKKFFRENLKSCQSVIGTFDDVKGDYNVTINYKDYGPTQSYLNKPGKTATFNERNKGWTSLKSFIPESGLSVNADYLTANKGNLYIHHVERDKRLDAEGNVIGPNPGEFYGEKVNSNITMIFNDSPNIVKSFKTIGYEGTKPAITEFNTESVVNANNVSVSNSGLNSLVSDGNFDNLKDQSGWFAETIKTDLEEGEPVHFKSKEGKWFSNLIGVSLDPNTLNIDTIPSQNFTIQGIGRAKEINSDAVNGCTCPDSNNYNPLADVDDGSCNNVGIIYGCTDNSYQEYNAAATHRKVSCIDPSDPCLNLHVYGCNVTLNQAGDRVSGVSAYANGFVAINESNLATIDDGSCIQAIEGCTDPSATNYNPSANLDDGTCKIPKYGCMDELAFNYDPSADTNAEGHNLGGYYGNPCIFSGCLDPLAVNNILEGNNSVEAFKIAKSVMWKNDTTGVNVSYPPQFINQDDCLYPTFGCTDQNALNYNPDATIDDGTCEYQTQFDVTIDEI